MARRRRTLAWDVDPRVWRDMLATLVAPLRRGVLCEQMGVLLRTPSRIIADARPVASLIADATSEAVHYEADVLYAATLALCARTGLVYAGTYHSHLLEDRAGLRDLASLAAPSRPDVRWGLDMARRLGVTDAVEVVVALNAFPYCVSPDMASLAASARPLGRGRLAGVLVDERSEDSVLAFILAPDSGAIEFAAYIRIVPLEEASQDGDDRA